MVSAKPGISPSEEALIGRIRAGVKLHTRLSDTFRRGALTTGGVMILSVAIIPFAHNIYCNALLSWGLVSLGVAGLTASLWLYWLITKAALYGA